MPVILVGLMRSNAAHPSIVVSYAIRGPPGNSPFHRFLLKNTFSSERETVFILVFLFIESISPHFVSCKHAQAKQSIGCAKKKNHPTPSLMFEYDFFGLKVRNNLWLDK
jgi:hypothetical protein